MRNYPTISIVIPMRNEELYISECIEGFMNQTYPSDRFNVIVVDGMSDDKSVNIVKSYQKKYKNILLLDNKKKIASNGFNIGIKASENNYVGIFSAHSVPNKDYIEIAINTIQRSGAECVGGPMDAKSRSLVGSAISYATSVPFGIGASKFHYSKKEEFVQTVYQGIFDRKIFDRIGFFDEDLIRNQDDEMSYRIRKSGGKILFNPQIKSIYHSRSTLVGLARQYFQYGLYKPLVFKKLRYGMQVHHFIPSIFTLYILLFINYYVYPSFYIPLAFYVATSIIYTFKAILNKVPAMTFIIFPILHISYGLGFLFGIPKMISAGR